jgi:probable HAF family extracellular repeat protein
MATHRVLRMVAAAAGITICGSATITVSAFDSANASTLPPGPWFIGLGDLPGGESNSRAQAMTPNGDVVVGVGTSWLGSEAFIWTYGSDDGMVGLGDLPGGQFQSVATGVSTSGTVVVGWSASAAGAQEAYRWVLGLGMQPLGDLPGDEDVLSAAFGVSSGGEVVVGWGSPKADEREAFRWTISGGMEGLGFLDGGLNASRAYAVSGDGSVITGTGNSGIGVSEAFIWTPARGMLGLGFLPDAFLDGTQAFGISFDGTTVVGGGWAVIGVESLRWTKQRRMAPIGDLPGGGSQPFSYGFAVSADGRTVVGMGNTDQASQAYIWDHQHGMRNLGELLVNQYGLNLDGWILREAKAVSLFGRTIAGWGVYEGSEQAWLARLGPACPGDLNDDGVVDLVDALELLGTMGDCDPCEYCPADLNGDCVVSITDFTAMLATWGPCP